MRPVLWITSAAHGRYEISDVCFDQWSRVIADLNKTGIEAYGLVIANDDNLDIARSYGFVTIERENLVGRKVNDGVEYACRKGSADYVAPIGSDDWVLPAYFDKLPDERTIRSGRTLAVINPNGTRLARIRSDSGFCIPWIIPRQLLAPCGYRPVDDQRMRGIDGSMLAGIRKHLPACEHDFDPFWAVEVDSLQVVDFKNNATQVTAYHHISAHPWCVGETGSPWRTLATRYPQDLVDRMRAVYKTTRELQAEKVTLIFDAPAHHLFKNGGRTVHGGEAFVVSRAEADGLLSGGYVDVKEVA